MRSPAISLRLYTLLASTVFLVVATVLALACALSGAAAASATALSARESPPAQQPDATGVQLAPQGILTSALTSDVESLDPAQTTDANSLLVTAQLYETLFAYPAGGTLPTAGLVTDWVSTADGITWTLTLRPGVEFHDGTALDAAAVVYNIQRWWDPDHPFHQGGFFYFETFFNGFKGDPDCRLLDVTAVGPRQVQLVFRQRYSILPTIFASAAFGIASPAAIQSGNLAEAPVGTGPFRFASHTPGAAVRLAANPAYWGDLPQLADLVFQVIPDDGDRLAALQSGAVQAADAFAAGQITQIADPGLKILWRPAVIVGYMGINRAHGPLGNELVRRAIAHAIDRRSLLAAYYPPGSQVASQLVPPIVWGHDPTIVDYAYDPGFASDLLAQAGYTTGFTTTLAYRNVVRPYLPDPAGAAAAIRADLLAVGIDATVVEMQSAPFLDAVYAGELDLFMLGWGADFPHPLNFLGAILCDGTLAFGAQDSELCNQLIAAQMDPSLAGQQAKYQAASRRAQATLPLLPLVYSRDVLVERSNVALLPSATLEVYRDAFFTDAWTVTPSAAFSATVVAGEGLTTNLQLDAGAVTTPTVLVYTAAPSGTVPALPTYALAGHAFTLEAFQGSEQVQLAPTVPITLVLDYGGADLSGVDAATVGLHYWNGIEWTTEGITVVAHDIEQRRLTVQLAHLSDFALFARLSNQVYLPLTGR